MNSEFSMNSIENIKITGTHGQRSKQGSLVTNSQDEYNSGKFDSLDPANDIQMFNNQPDQSPSAKTQSQENEKRDMEEQARLRQAMQNQQFGRQPFPDKEIRSSKKSDVTVEAVQSSNG